MKLNLMAFSLAFSLLWGSAILIVGVVNLIIPDYGAAFLESIASVYPGYDPGGSLGSVMVGTLYGLLDGGIGGALLAWLYNQLVIRFPSVDNG